MRQRGTFPTPAEHGGCAGDDLDVEVAVAVAVVAIVVVRVDDVVVFGVVGAQIGTT